MAAIQGAGKHAGAITKMVYKLYSILLQLNQPSVEATAHFSLNLSAVGNGRASVHYYW